jgi:hypothetical protein
MLLTGPAPAADLYVTDFEAPTFSIGTIHDQDAWVVSVDEVLQLDGQIVASGDGHGQVLQILAGDGWAIESHRLYTQSTERYLVVEMDFNQKDAGGFWFNDNNDTAVTAPGGPETILWDDDPVDGRRVWSNANPGIATPWPYSVDTWYHVAIEVDQQSKEITRINYNNEGWLDEDDTPDTPEQINWFTIRGHRTGGVSRMWIDNLSITDWSPGGLAGDVDGNGVVDGLDLTAVISAWETIPGDLLWNENADLDESRRQPRLRRRSLGNASATYAKDGNVRR